MKKTALFLVLFAVAILLLAWPLHLFRVYLHEQSHVHELGVRGINATYSMKLVQLLPGSDGRTYLTDGDAIRV